MRRSAAARTAMTSWAPGLLVLAALLAGGCGGEGGPAGELDRVDRLLDWTADTVATLGGAAAPAWAAFQEVTGVAVDGRGRVYLLDGPQRRLVVTDSSGRFRGRVGVRGEGPGEFRAPTRLGVADDGTVHVYDAAHGALLVFGPDAGADAGAGSDATHAFQGQYPVDEHGWIPAGPLRVDGARVVFAARPRGGAGSDASVARAAAGQARDARAVVAFRPPDSVAVLYRGWAPPIPLGRPLTDEETGGFRIRLPPMVGFAPELHVGLLPDVRVVVADSTTWTLRVLDGPGSAAGPPALLTRPPAPVPVTASLREAERARRQAALEADPPRVVVSDRDGGAATVTNDPVLRLERARIDAMGFHPVIPVIREMAVDPEGRIWVQRHTGVPGEPGPVDVVEPDGRYLGTLPPEGPGIPAAFGPGGRMVTVAADELGAPVVHILRLR